MEDQIHIQDFVLPLQTLEEAFVGHYEIVRPTTLPTSNSNTLNCRY